MAGKQIGATLVLREGNFFANVKKAQNESGKFKNSLGGATNKLKEQNKAMDSLARTAKNLAAGYLSIQGAKSFTGFSDQILSTTARLDGINDGLQSTNELNKMIYESAKNSRSEYQSTADLVTRLAGNASNAFSGTAEIVQFAEQLNKRFVIAGASAEEASNATLQLSQGLAAGALRGDELNSVLEQAPNIARSIEKYMGISEGSIKTVASQGLVTADVVKNAILSATDETNAQFAAMPMTFSQIAVSFKNRMREAVTPLIAEHIPGVTQKLESTLPQVIEGIQTGCEGVADAIGWMKQNWDWLGPVIYGVVTAITAYNVVTGITTGLQGFLAATTGMSSAAIAGMTATELIATSATTALGAAVNFLTSPLFLIVLAIGAVIAVGVLLYKNWDKIKEGASALWAKIKDCFGKMKEWCVGVWDGICEGVKGGINWVLGGINSMIKGAVDGINKLIGGINKVTGVVGIPEIPLLTAPQIPMLASGGIITRAGMTIVGERGPELLSLPRGASVIPLSKRDGGNHNTFHINIYTNELDDEAINRFVSKVKFAMANM